MVVCKLRYDGPQAYHHSSVSAFPAGVTFLRLSFHSMQLPVPFFFLRNDSERLEKALAVTVLQMSVDPLEQEFYKLVFSGTFNKIIQNRQNQAASWERTASELRKLTGPCLPQWQLSHCLLASCRYLLWWGFFQFCVLTVLLFRIFIRLL